MPLVTWCNSDSWSEVNIQSGAKCTTLPINFWFPTTDTSVISFPLFTDALSFTAHYPYILDDELSDVAETKKLQADAGPTTLPVYASEGHEPSNTPEPIAGPSGVGTKAPGHQPPENFDVKTPGRQQPAKFDVDEFLAFLDDYNEAGFNKASGCPQPEREDFDVDEFVALLNDYGKAGHCLFSLFCGVC